MVKQVSPETLKIALDSWEQLKATPEYEKDGGKKVMKILFEKCPKAKPMFGYDFEAEVDEEFMSDPKFIAHSTQLIGMFDQALAMMGPDGNLLEEKICELGEKHVKYGVRAEMFPIMGKALISMLSDELGDKFDHDLKKAWTEVFSVISTDLMKTVLKASVSGEFETAQNNSKAIAA